MKNVITILSLTLTTSFAMAGTYTLNSTCQTKVAEVSKAIVSVNLSSGMSITDTQVDPNVKAAEAYLPTTVSTNVSVKTAAATGVISTVAEIVDLDTDCQVLSVTINK